MRTYVFSYCAVNKNDYGYDKVVIRYGDSLKLACENFEKELENDKQKLISYNVWELGLSDFRKKM